MNGEPIVLGQAHPKISQRRASVAHQRANYFFPEQGGGGARKGARACGNRSVSDIPEKKRYIDFGAVVGYYVV